MQVLFWAFPLSQHAPIQVIIVCNLLYWLLSNYLITIFIQIITKYTENILFSLPEANIMG